MPDSADAAMQKRLIGDISALPKNEGEEREVAEDYDSLVGVFCLG